jgi:acyl carrier protein
MTATTRATDREPPTGNRSSDMDSQLATIRGFVARHLNGFEPADEDDLFASGHLTSLFAVQIVMFVESTFGVEVVGEDLNIGNFASIARIDRYVAGRLADADLTAKA